MFSKFKQIFAKRNKPLRERILFTLICLSIFIVGINIKVPGTIGIDDKLDFLDLLDIMGGGALKSSSIFALGVMPYISASIVVQLLQMDIFPYFSDLAKEGYNGRRKLNRITRYLGILVALIQGFALSLKIVDNGTAFEYIRVSIILAAGTAFLLWLGDQITKKGIGNGLSLIIMSGIVVSFPAMFRDAFDTFVLKDANLFLGIVKFTTYILVYLLVVAGVVFISESERRIPIQYANKTTSSYGAKQTYIPFKVNAASVIPVIFASAVMSIPQMLTYFITNAKYISFVQKWTNYTTVRGLIIYLVLIIIFSFVYTIIQFKPEEIAKNLQQNGGYIPGVRPGEETKKYITSVLLKITTFGTLFLVVIAALPILFQKLPFASNTNVTLGGTSLIIIVGVALETFKQIESVVDQKEYKGRF